MRNAFLAAAAWVTNRRLSDVLVKTVSLAGLLAPASVAVLLSTTGMAKAQNYSAADLTNYQHDLENYAKQHPHLYSAELEQYNQRCDWLRQQEAALAARMNAAAVPYQQSTAASSGNVLTGQRNLESMTPAIKSSAVTPTPIQAASSTTTAATTLAGAQTRAPDKIVRYTVPPNYFSHSEKTSRYEYVAAIYGGQVTAIVYRHNSDGSSEVVAPNHPEMMTQWAQNARSENRSAAVTTGTAASAIQPATVTASHSTAVMDPRDHQVASIESSTVTDGISLSFHGRTMAVNDIAAKQWADEIAKSLPNDPKKKYDGLCLPHVSDLVDRFVGGGDFRTSGLFYQIPYQPGNERYFDIAHETAAGQKGHYAAYLGEWWSGPWQDNTKGRPTIYANDTYAARGEVTIFRLRLPLLSEQQQGKTPQTTIAANTPSTYGQIATALSVSASERPQFSGFENEPLEARRPFHRRVAAALFRRVFH